MGCAFRTQALHIKSLEDCKHRGQCTGQWHVSYCPSKEWQGSGDTQQVFRSEGKCKLKKYWARSEGTERQGTGGVGGCGVPQRVCSWSQACGAEPEAGLREAISQWILTKKEEKVGRRAVRT